MLFRSQQFKNLTIVICGDIINSRVARSNIKLLTQLGSNIRLVGPNTLLPKFMLQNNMKIFVDLSKAINQADVVYSLRIQKERMRNSSVPSSKEYYDLYGINHKILKKASPNCIVLHPGPMNRDIEISTDLADDMNICMVLKQVRNGVAIRQAVLEFMN